jgi:hypothetical protein
MCDEGDPFLKREVITKNVIDKAFLHERSRGISESISSAESKTLRPASQQFGGVDTIHHWRLAWHRNEIFILPTDDTWKN